MSRIPVPLGVSRIPQPAARRQSVSAPRRDSLGPTSGNIAVVPPPSAKRAARPSSLTIKPSFDPTAAVQAKAEKLARQKQAREDKMAAKKLAEAEESEARRKKAEMLANERQDRLVGSKPAPKAPRVARQSGMGARAAVAPLTIAASKAASTKAPPSPAVKKPRVDPQEHARKKQEAVAQAKKLREERMAESKRRAAERKAEQEREEAARQERLQNGGNPFGPTQTQPPPQAAPEPECSVTRAEAPRTEAAPKRKEETTQLEEQTERLKRQRQAQLEARMANPDCLRNSSCQCKDCAAFNPTREITTTTVPVAPQLDADVCLRTTSCTCANCAREPAVAAPAIAPPVSPTPDPGRCLRTSDCRCDECVALTAALPTQEVPMTQPVKSPMLSDQPESACQRSLTCGCPECANVRNVNLLAHTPGKVVQAAQQEEEPALEMSGKNVCMRSSDCSCDNCAAVSSNYPVARGLGAVLQQALAVPQSAEQPEPQICPDLTLELGSRIDARVGPS